MPEENRRYSLPLISTNMSYRAEDLNYIEPKRGVWLSLSHSVINAIAPRNQSTRARRPENKSELEQRQAALFSFARASLENNDTVRFAMVPEESDSADTILRKGCEPHFEFERVQLKEIVPDTVDAQHTLENLLESIRRRYCTGEVLSVAIHLNRDLVTSLGTLSGPSLPSITFWLFGINGPNKGFIVKDPFGHYELFEFDIPRAPSSITNW